MSITESQAERVCWAGRIVHHVPVIPGTAQASVLNKSTASVLNQSTHTFPGLTVIERHARNSVLSQQTHKLHGNDYILTTSRPPYEKIHPILLSYQAVPRSPTCEKMSTLESRDLSFGSSLSSRTILPAFSTRWSPVVYGGPGSAPWNRYGWLQHLRSCIAMLSSRERSPPPER